MALNVRDSRALWLIAVLGIAGALYVAKAVFIPLAVAVLLTFVLAPPARLLRQWGLPRVPAALVVVLLAFISIMGLGFVVGEQLNQLASELPRYEYTITRKIQNIREAVGSGGTLQSMSELLNHLNQQTSPQGAAPAPNANRREPTPVQVIEPPLGPAEVIRRVVEPLVDPLTTSGLILLFVTFFLLERETLRDRVIRLAGSHDLRRTTQLMDDGARRLSRYFLAQTLLNAFFGGLVAIGLTLIGVPNPILWGILAMVLRFVPYLGAWIAAAFPIVISFAVDPGWSKTVWTTGFFLVLEPIIGQVIEPLLYGHSTGLTPVAVIVSATFWTWLWGPIGLLLSTPLAVCLGVLGRHIESLEFLEVMIGDDPPLSPAQAFYHRALSGTEHEVLDQVEEALKEGKDLATCYQDIVVEALVLAEVDRHRGILDDEHAHKINNVVQSVLAELADEKGRPAVGSDHNVSPAAEQEPAAPPAVPAAAAGRPVLIVGGPGQFDHTIALLLAQLLEQSGIQPRLQPHTAISPVHIAQLDTTGLGIIYLSFLQLGHNPSYLRYSIRRIRRRFPSTKIVACLWGCEEKEILKPDLLAAGADTCVFAFAEALALCREPPPSAEETSRAAPENGNVVDLITPALPGEPVATELGVVPA
jgi:predicted PurR-regulated permease PerM